MVFLHSWFSNFHSQGLFSRITFREPVFLGGTGNITGLAKRLPVYEGMVGCIRRFIANEHEYKFEEHPLGDVTKGFGIRKLNLVVVEIFCLEIYYLFERWSGRRHAEGKNYVIKKDMRWYQMFLEFLILTYVAIRLNARMCANVTLSSIIIAAIIILRNFWNAFPKKVRRWVKLTPHLYLRPYVHAAYVPHLSFELTNRTKAVPFKTLWFYYLKDFIWKILATPRSILYGMQPPHGLLFLAK